MWRENIKNFILCWLIRRTHIYRSTIYYMLYSMPLPIIKTLIKQVEENTNEKLANEYRPIRFIKHPDWIEN